MIDKRNCTSCGICAVACPKDAISFGTEDGFPIPVIDTKVCVRCGACDKVCIKNVKIESKEGCSYYAAWTNAEDELLRSSSGGIAFEIAAHCVKEGYRFFGVRMNVEELIAETYSCETVEELEASRGSKYVTSHALPGLIDLRKTDKPVVAVGTPCQIVAIDKYLRKMNRRDDAILIDLLCAGPASEMVLQQYVDEKLKKAGKSRADLMSVFFRDKTKLGWSATMKIVLKDGTEIRGADSHWADGFFSIFFSRACQKQACYRCRLDRTRTCADIRLSDFWGQKFKNNKQGVSAVIVCSPKGMKLIKAIKQNVTIFPVEGEEIFASQLDKPQRKPFERPFVMAALRRGVSLDKIRLNYVRPIVLERTIRKKIIRHCKTSKNSFIKSIGGRIRT